MTTPLSEIVRPHFPALRRTVAGEPAAFLDGPAGTQVPTRVIEAVADYLAHHNANTHGEFATSAETDRILTDAREAVADFIGAPSGREIAFGASMTALTFSFSRALAQEWEPGDEIVVTDLDHQANVAPWRRAAEDRGARVRVLPFDPETLTLRYDALEEILGPRTRLVAVGCASNAVGTINDVARVAALAREAGALTYADAVHLAPHRVIDVRAMGCDFLAFSAYKFFGPHVGILWGRAEHLERLRPYKVPPSSDAVPERWESGTLNHEGIAGTLAAIEWIAALAEDAEGDRRGRLRSAMARLERAEEAAFERLLAGVSAVPGARVYGPPGGTPRTPTLAFTLEGRSAEEIARYLGERGIFVWNGDFYASTVVERLGLADRGGLVRVGLAPYNTVAEIDRLLAALSEIAGR